MLVAAERRFHDYAARGAPYWGEVSGSAGLLWRLTRHCPYLITGLRRAGFVGGWL